LNAKTVKAVEMPAREILFYEFDEFRLDVKKEELLRDSDPVPLTHKAFQVLLILVQNFGQTVEKENIYQELWGDSFVEDANLTQHIYILRKTLGPDPSGESYIETVARSGYRFTADINTIYASVIPPRAEPARNFTPSDDESEEPPEELTVPERPRLTLLRKVSETSEEEAVPSVPEPDFHKLERKKKLFSGRLIIWGLALIAFSILTGLAVRQFILRKTAPALSVSLAKSIAVLPLKPIGAESANEKLGLGMADAIITRLGRLRVIPVRPTSSVFRYTDQPPESSLSAGHELGVDTVLEGTVQRDDERVRVSVRLINVSDASTVWAENFDENFTNIFNVQDSISAKVVRALQVSLTPQEEKLVIAALKRQH
jgi:TolB-like protein/DNA-binding winged helix-turn-helix (wHTH) protein